MDFFVKCYMEYGKVDLHKKIKRKLRSDKGKQYPMAW